VNNAVLLQLAGTADYLKLVSLYFDRHTKYCAEHGFDYIVQGGPVANFGEQPLIGWAKIAMMQKLCMQGYEYIVYLDADAYIADTDVELRAACLKPITMVRWWDKQSQENALSHLQGGVIYVHSLPPSVNQMNAYSILSTLLQEAKYYIDMYPGMRGWYEQGLINQLAQHPWFKDFFGEVPIEFNWGVHSHVECDRPVIMAFHGVRPMDVLYNTMKESIENGKGQR
jgi:hypothetical protein